VKVFVDTNVWLSARLHAGLCARLLEALIEAGAELLLDERVRDEFQRIAKDKFAVDDGLLARTMVFFDDYATLVPAAHEPVASVPDPDDALIVAAALAAAADWFVSGDRDLLACDCPGPLLLLAPREALQRLLATR